MRYLTRTPVLWGLAGAVLFMSLGFVYIMHRFDFLLIDEMWDPEKIHQHIEGLSSKQKTIHIWTTATLDVLYPLAYGGLFIGLVRRVFGASGRILAIPGALVIPVDLAEGAIQVLALIGNEDAIVHKMWVTPIKFGLFVTAAIFALVAIAVALMRKFKTRRTL